MGMVGTFRLVRSEYLDEIRFDPEALEEFLLGNEESAEEIDEESVSDPGGSLYVDKAWHGLHFILTGTASEGDPPLNFILGGEALDYDTGYGPPRMFLPAELQKIAKAIEPIDDAEIARRYDPERMKKLRIYPNIWDRKDENNLEYLQETWGLLKPFVQKGAAEGFALVVFLS